MHIFRIRPKSQKRSARSQDYDSASNRPPLLPQTNAPGLSSSSLVNNLDASSSKRPIGTKISPDEPKSEVQSTRSLAPPPMSPHKTAYANQSDIYLQNDLNTFSFGAAPSSSSSSSSVHLLDPLSRPRDDPDTDDPVLVPDITPRPSVVGSKHLRSRQSPPLVFNKSPIRPSQTKSGRVGRRNPRKRDSDTASAHTFGTSSASASISSCSRPSGANSRAASRTSHCSDTTPQTSENDLSSDEEGDGRHPLPAEFSSPDLPVGHRRTDQDSLMCPSEEEFDDDYDHDPEIGIEIGSVAHPGSDRGTISYHSASRESVRFDYTERRGSQALPINVSPERPSSDRSYLEDRMRENSLATLRRPSRSLEELYSFSFAQEAESSSSASRTEHPLPPAPTSVPQSEGDWRDLRKKSIQRDKDPSAVSPHMVSTTSAANQNTPGLDDFDSSWMHHGVTGVIGFDASEMEDIVGNSTGHRPSNIHPFRKGSTFRRQSTVSSNNVDIIYKYATGKWASQKYRDQQRMWMFVKEHDRLPHEDIQIRQNNHMERERPSISSLFASRPSTGTLEPGVISGGIPFFDSRDKEKAPVKDKTPKESWRGMPLDSEEFWNNQATGRFRVHRKNTPYPEVGKPPQQRLNITFIRTPYVVNPITREVLDGPTVTIHRHSKADAFSISRHFRAKSFPNPSDTTVSFKNTTLSSRGPPHFRDSSDGVRKRSNMILLGTRKVQKAYTSTNTTRKLECHGLLDDSGRVSPGDLERIKKHERETRGKAKVKDHNRDNDKKGREVLKRKGVAVNAIKMITNNGEVKSKESKQMLPDSSGSSAGSVVNASDSGTCVNSSTATTPDEGPSSHGSIDHSVISYETNSSDRTILRPAPSRNRHGRGHSDDIDDNSSDEGPRYPTRTPHRETYAVLPPEVFESARHQEHPTHGIFGWGKSRSGNQIGHLSNPYEASYNPPWPVTAPRINSETRKGIVDDLNMSFQDVGLLPAIGEIRHSHSGRKRERDQQPIMPASRKPDQPQAEIFESIPADALCMLLPLWPGETDPASARKHPFTPPPLSTNSRQYILVYYKAQPTAVPPQQEEKTKAAEKKRSRVSPTSSHDSVNKREERGVLLTNFYINARIVSHRELQGTGIRIPDVGLAVSGPLDDAYGCMPNMSSDVQFGEYILGVCNSRDAGIDFLQEGFDKMGLSRTMPNPNPIVVDDDDDSQSLGTVAVLTPLGRAVMEMAWLGGLALTSFNPSG